MQNFNAPKKGNKGVVKAYLIALAMFVLVAIGAHFYYKDEVKTGSNSSEETMFASAK